ncbi:host specificity factor TipJ family phage tail protein [Acidaminococcus massiliensis]|jgi:predicted phage tail protein|uniref:host specificity factor TipJ family phage tail protein n=1 Tax=Acidaminococcus massiliensis TaxID=1852375 RepID=UPI002050FD6C|nr:host specificity factor TipJ family phage tail protein [Acidaminococcus massiliensis]DAR24857.1 MAG TPA: tail protein [Caudoviricetes sp.]
MFKLCIVKNPFNPAQGREIRQMGHGITVEQLIQEYEPGGEIVLKATVNAHSVEDDYVIQDGDFVVLYPYIGKGGAKRLFSVVAMIGLSLAAGWAGGLVTKLGGTAFLSNLASAAVMFIGGALISHFTPRANLDKGKYDDGKSTATYSWNGPQVMEGQNNAIPVIYGKVKTAGQSIGKYVNNDGDKEYLNWLIAVGEGPLTISDIKINENDASYYTGVTIETREGTNDQTIIPNFNDTYFTKESDYKLTTTERIVSVQGNGTQGIIVSIEFPNGLYYANDKGGLDTAWVEFDCGYRKKGTAEWNNLLSDRRISGATSSAIRRQWRVDNLEAGEYEVMVKVLKRSHDENSSRASVKAYLTGVTSIVYDDFAYPNVALVGIKALATDQLNGTPSVSFLVERKSVWVYNPHSKQYEEKPANNPAWASYDYIHQCRRIKNIHTGNYEFVVKGADKRLMLYDQFKSWAEFCTEKKLYINYCDDSEGRLMDKLNTNIAPIGRGYVLWFGTKCGCIFDSVKEPVQMFGMGNIISGTFQEDFLQTSDRANAIELTFTDADNDYNRTTVMVYGDNYDSDDAIQKTTSVTYDGITSYEQAFRTAKYLLACNQYLVRTVSFEASVDAIACQVGDLILVSHDVTRWAYSGRIESVDGTTLKLPCEVEDLTKQYKIMYRTQDDVLHEKNITIQSSENGWTICSVANWDNDTPHVNDVFDISYVDKGSKPFVVKSITRTQDLTRKIECLEYNENVFNENYDIPEIDYSMDAVNLQNVISLTGKQTAYIENDAKICKLYASWELPHGATDCKYEIQLSTDGETYTTVRNFYPYKTVTLDTEFGKSYYIKVISLYGGKKSTGITYGPIDPAVTEAPPVQNLYAYNRYRTQNDGKSRYDIVVKWTVPGGPAYSQAQVWYKTDHDQVDSIVVKEGVAADELGFQGSWKYAGQGYDEVTIPQANVGDTYKIAVVSVDRWGTIGDPDTSPQTKIKVMMKSDLPNTPDGFKISFTDKATAEWNEVTNTDIMYYEVKQDKGDKDSLVRTTGLTADLPLTSRSGTLYLFAVNALGKYSLPAVLNYNKPKPKTPTPPVLVSNMTGFQAGVPSVPEGCLGCVFRVNNADIIKTLNRTMAYNCKEGIYNVTCAYYDLFGEGDESATSSITVKLHVDQSHLDAEAVSLDKVDKAVKAQLDSGVSAEEAVRVVNNNLSSKDGYKNYTALTQLDDAINLRVEKDKAISQINLCPETITLDGKFIHVTGDTVFDNNVIANGMIQAGAVSADKLAAQTISLTDKLTIAAGQVNLDDTGLKLTGSDGGYTKFDGDGIKYVDSSGIEYASVRKMIIGKAYDGQYVKFAAPWSIPPSVMTVPMSIQTNSIGYDNTNTYIVCEPTEITSRGFRVNNYLRLQSGAYSLVKSNYNKTWTTTENFTYTAVRESTYMVFVDFWQDIFSTTIPNTATHFEANVQFTFNPYDNMKWGYFNDTTGGMRIKKDSRYHARDGKHKIGLQLVIDGKTQDVVWSSEVTNYSENTINTTLSANFSQGVNSIKIRTIWNCEVTIRASNTLTDDINDINAHRNDAAMCLAQCSRLIIPSYKFQSGESKIARGYAMFLVTDGGTNNYTLED